MRLLIRSLLRRARSDGFLSVASRGHEMGEGRCSTTEVSSTNGSGMAYDFNNEYRDTNDNTERERKKDRFVERPLSRSIKRCNIAARMSLFRHMVISHFDTSIGSVPARYDIQPT
jgi:hypothetical protein